MIKKGRYTGMMSGLGPNGSRQVFGILLRRHVV